MKAVVADYRTQAFCVRIVPVSGTTVRLTDHPRDLTMGGGQVYVSTSGYQLSGYSATAGFSPGNLDLEGVCGIGGVTRAAVASGAYDGARVYFFATSWAAPVEDEEALVLAIFGKTTLRDERYTIEAVTLVDALGQTVGETYGTQCPKVFCGTKYAGCGVSLAANTVTGALSGVTSASVFTSAARTEPADTFGAGTIRFTTGANAGLKAQDVKSFAGGVITVHEPFYYLPVIGDQYSMVRGCRKRITDCQSRWNGTATFSNIVNFGGFLWIPDGSTYAQVGQGG